jgi:hypothetical protein
MGHIIPAGTGFNTHRNVNIKALVEELPPEEEPNALTAELEQPLAG